MRRECEATATLHASPDAVWGVVSDVSRVGEWSGECRGCAWEGKATAPAVSARFSGRNRRGWASWSRLSEIDRVEPAREIVWHTVPSILYRDSTEWRVRLRPVREGTEVSVSFRVLQLSRVMESFLGLLLPAHRDRSEDLADDLARLRTVVERVGAAG